MLFNKKVLELRDKKKNLVEELNRDIDRLEQIQVILGQSSGHSIKRPSMRIEEVPEKKYEYTKEKLLEFKKELESKAANSNKHDDDGGGFGGFGAGAAKPNSAKKSEQAQIESATSKSSHLESVRPLWHDKESMSLTLRQVTQAKEIKLIFIKNFLIKIMKKY